MTIRHVHTIQTAPPASKRLLEDLQHVFGFVPNVAGVMAESPVLLAGFASVFSRVHSGTLTEAQIQTLLLTNAVTNKSSWPVALHTSLALKEGISPEDVEAIRGAKLPANPQLASLSHFARALIEARGHVEDAQVSAMRAAGFRADQVLEVILVVAASVMTNYTANITHPPLEAALEPYTWAY